MEDDDGERGNMDAVIEGRQSNDEATTTTIINNNSFPQNDQFKSSLTRKPSSSSLSRTNYVKRRNRSRRQEVTNKRNSGQIAEYAQYLGLQPLKCTKCTELKQPNCSCGTMSPGQSPLASTSRSPGTTSPANVNANQMEAPMFCSSCGIYCETWEMFGHMLEVHQRYICLFCRGLFADAERLAQHLLRNHGKDGIDRLEFTTLDEFHQAFRSPCYLMCCDCNKVFSERDNFHNHECPKGAQPTQQQQQQNLCCRQVDAHSASCQLSSEKSNSNASPESSRSSEDSRRPPPARNNNNNNRPNCPDEAPVEQQQQQSNNEQQQSTETTLVQPQVNSLPQVVNSPPPPPPSRDTVAETIMEVSRCVVDADKTLGLLNNKVCQRLDDTLEDASETNECASSSPFNDQQQQQELSSPVSRSLFSPQRELSSERDVSMEMDNNEQPAAVAAAAVEQKQSDRSLVIKICTDKNARYSIVQQNNLDNHKPVETSDEVERVLDREESDSDSERLAVVDSSNVDSDNEKSKEDNTTTLEREISKEEDEPSGGGAIAIDNDYETKEEELLPQESKQEKEEEEQQQQQQQQEQEEEPLEQPSDGIVLAGDDSPTIDLNVDGTLDSLTIQELLRGCIAAASLHCVFCSHARFIAVNGKQFALHVLAEHRFQPQHPAIIIQREQFVARVKRSLDELETCYFNYDSYDSQQGTYCVPEKRIYECFHCRLYFTVHKELYLHNRTKHQKAAVLICIMCKSTFYNYGELLCHLCPGIYSPANVIRYRCCMCEANNIPSSFRLMVHLRKRHHSCDVCLEYTGNQHKLSNHVWKHKLQHLCYRCGIAYRNKPDITKHLFWKHGTESVLCKKCLQKKWPHFYHFCLPPAAFTCEDCNSTFSRAVALKVHKRLHVDDYPYGCEECGERFISRKLLRKHENAHREPPPPPTPPPPPVVIEEPAAPDVEEPFITVDDKPTTDNERISIDGVVEHADAQVKDIPVVKKVVDVYDLPPLNLSSESESEAEEEKSQSETVEDSRSIVAKIVEDLFERAMDSVATETCEDKQQEETQQIVDGIWDNFKSYAASLGQQQELVVTDKSDEVDLEFLKSVILADHDYWVVHEPEKKEEILEEPTAEKKETEQQTSAEVTTEQPAAVETAAAEDSDAANKKKPKSPRKKKQSTSSSDSSSDSDSSSCSCGTNCSCSSSSSGSSSSSSSSSDSDSSESESSPKKQQQTPNKKEQRKKDKELAKKSSKEQQETTVDVTRVEEPPEPPQETVQNEIITPQDNYVARPKIVMRESDLDTDETETDEDFYDENPQEFARLAMLEKRNQMILLANQSAVQQNEIQPPLNNGIASDASAASTTMMMPVEQEAMLPVTHDVNARGKAGRRKVKTKKRKKTKQQRSNSYVNPIKLNISKSYCQEPLLVNQQQQQQPKEVKKKGPVGRPRKRPLLGPKVTPKASPKVSTPLPPKIKLARSSISSIGGSGSESEAVRSSKRRRIPKKFYDDSSDEEGNKIGGGSQQQPPIPIFKWRKVDECQPSAAPLPRPPSPLQIHHHHKMIHPVTPQPPTQLLEPPAPAPLRMTISNRLSHDQQPLVVNNTAKDSSSSSDSEVELPKPKQLLMAPRESADLLCYCRKPYDGVTGMIACDNRRCRIEWFHFECVGVVQPPQGQWFCPECRRIMGINENFN